MGFWVVMAGGIWSVKIGDVSLFIDSRKASGEMVVCGQLRLGRSFDADLGASVLQADAFRRGFGDGPVQLPLQGFAVQFIHHRRGRWERGHGTIFEKMKGLAR